MTAPGIGKIPYGGDYNPEQWPEAVRDDDHRLFTQARIDTLTVGVFAWSLTQPAEDAYDFGVLDGILERAAAEGRRVCLATGTAALPPWLARAHPDVNRTDFEGRRHRYGQRHNFCPSSPAYKSAATALAGRVAERYAGHPALLAWHIGNEYGGACYCDLCAEAFRRWLREHHGGLDALNDAWYTAYWSHRYTDWDQIEPPARSPSTGAAPTTPPSRASPWTTCASPRTRCSAASSPRRRRSASTVPRRPSPPTSWACTARSTTTAGRPTWTSPPGTTTRPWTPRRPGRRSPTT